MLIMKTSNQKIAIIGTAGVPGKYGGFETLAEQLVRNLAKENDIRVYASAKLYTKKERVKYWEGALIHYLPLSANGISSIIYDVISMIHALFFSDVLYIMGVSGCLMLPFISWIPKKKIVVNIDGLEWTRAKWSPFAKKFLKLSEKTAIRFADEIVADNAAIQKYVFEQYGRVVSLIEYGGDHVQSTLLTQTLVEEFPFLNQAYAVKVARIVPENNIHVVLEAFSKNPRLPLVIIGNWNHSPYGQRLKDQYSAQEHIHILDPIYEPQKINAIRTNADLYIHGHSAGGTNPSLVEAMNLGLPIVAFGVVYNKITTENKAIYFQNQKELDKIMEYLPYLGTAMVGFAMQRIARERYTWERISQKYLALADVKHSELKVPTFNFELPSYLLNPDFKTLNPAA